MDVSDDFALLQLQLAQNSMRQTDEEFEERVIACTGLIIYGLEEARRLRSERQCLRRLYLTRPDLLPNPRQGTPWQVLYESQNDRAFITTMGFNVATFHKILDHGFRDLWNTLAIPCHETNINSRPQLGRRSLDAEGALGLVLHWLNSTMLDVSLMQIFTLIPTTVSRYITFSLSNLLFTLHQMHEACIQWLVGDEFQENNNLIIDRHPLLNGAFGSMDGLNLAVQTSPDQEIENATFNGWLHNHFVSSVFAFSVKGRSHSACCPHQS